MLDKYLSNIRSDRRRWGAGAGIVIAAIIAVAGAINFARGPESPQLPNVAVAQLPAEARETLRRIERGGPFPYPKDGSVFGNRERLLPGQPRGYYREYTVPTPGARDRGARRIVAGRDGDRYYTQDHYRSFSRIVP
jgi:ribonuclease T1